LNTGALEQDVNDMQQMLEGYLAFARGEGDEVTGELDLETLLGKLESEAKMRGKHFNFSVTGKPLVYVKASAFTRLVTNLTSNAFRHADTVTVTATHAKGWLTLLIDDDGPGIPKESREDVFRPFVRLDEARNQDEGGTGLGLSIARDIANAHGGTITLAKSPIGGLRALVKIPA
jgi:two-component system, OmpR family, osmolarity sensor histidine kinase EnvZ